MAVPTDLNVVLAFLPRVVMAPMQTTTIRASMTAYSTAVGPSSRFKNSTTKLPSFRMCFLHWKKESETEKTQPVPTHEEDVLMAVPTEVNVLLALLPRVVMAPMQ